MKRRLLLAAGLLAGCSVLPAQQYQQRRDWPLVPRRPETAPSRRGERVLLIRTVSAAPGLEARGLQWLLKDGSVNVDYYEQWAAPPAQAMEEALRRWLTDAGLFAAVVAPGSTVTPDLVLEVELTAMHADFGAAPGAEPEAEPGAGVGAGVARVGLAMVLLEPHGDTTRVRLQRTEMADTRLAGTDAAAMVAALRDAAASVLGQVEAAVASAAEPPRRRPR